MFSLAPSLLLPLSVPFSRGGSFPFSAFFAPASAFALASFSCHTRCSCRQHRQLNLLMKRGLDTALECSKRCSPDNLAIAYQPGVMLGNTRHPELNAQMA